MPGEFEEKIKQPKSSGMSQSSAQDSRPQTPVSEYSRKELTARPSPKLTRASSKIFEKVRDFERRRSIDHEGSISGRSWAGFHRAPSVDSDDGGSRLGISRESSREDLSEALKADAAQRRSMFRQRAASLEDRPRYSQKVQDIESKFTEELQRIKKLVGKPHMKKSFSTEQLSPRKSRQPLRKLEPIPPQVLQKLQDRERAQQAQEERERESEQQHKEQSPPKSPLLEHSQREIQQCQQAPEQRGSPQPKLEPKRSTMSIVAGSRLGEEVSPPEAMSSSDLPGQRSPRQLRSASPMRESLRRSPVDVTHVLEERRRTESPSRNIVEMTLRKVEQRPPSPLVQRVIRVQEVPTVSEKEETVHRKTPVEITVRKLERRPESPLVQRDPVMIQERPVQPPPKPPRVSLPEEKMELDVTPLTPVPSTAPAPAATPLKRAIPTIIVEEEPMEVVPAEVDKPKKSSPAREEKPQRARGKGRRTRPMSPELGRLGLISSSN